MEKAKRDYFSSDPPGSYTADPFTDRLRKSNDDLKYRGPLLQSFHSGELHSRPDYLPTYTTSYSRTDPSPHDQVSF
jgi:hypothetical protein